MKRIIVCTLVLCACASSARAQDPPDIPFGATKMGIAALSLWGVAKIRESNRTLAIIVNFGMAAGFTAIAIHNSREATRGMP